MAKAGKPEADIAIANAAGEELKKLGFQVKMLQPEKLKKNEKADVVFTMARGKEVCALLEGFEDREIFVINSPKSIQDTLNRWKCYQLAAANGVILPPTEVMPLTEFVVDKKYILKRPDRHEFTTVISNQDELKKAIENYKQQGIGNVIKQEFIEGKHIKYYGIGEEVFLADNAEATEQAPVIKRIKDQAVKAANAVKLLVYGGDVLVKEDNVYLVDINDWPSFSSIREIAAKEIAVLIANEVNKRE